MKLSILSLLCCLLLCSSTITAQEANDWKSKIDPSLLAKTETENSVDFLIILKKQNPLTRISTAQTKSEKGRYVFQQLQKTAQESQKELASFLKKENAFLQSFYIINAIHAKGDLSLLEDIARRSDVIQIQDNPQIKLEEVNTTYDSSNGEVDVRTEAEWGIEMIGANQVWTWG